MTRRSFPSCVTFLGACNAKAEYVTCLTFFSPSADQQMGTIHQKPEGQAMPLTTKYPFFKYQNRSDPSKSGE
jgi:hypothetical protein